MATPKAKTLQQKLGFFDDDLKSPDHDTILKWLDSNIEKVLETLYSLEWDEKQIQFFKNKAIEIKEKELIYESENLTKKKSELTDTIEEKTRYEKQLDEELEEEKIKLKTEKDFYKSSNWTLEKIEKSKEKIANIEKEILVIERKIEYLNKFEGLDNEIPQKNKLRVTKITWEYTVTNQSYNERSGYKSSKGVIGFIDMRVDFIYTKLMVYGLNIESERISGKMQWGQTEKKSNTIDDLLRKTLLIEVKTKITSLGELFRQLNTYREFVSGDYLVVCSDDSNKETIINQGFMFYKFENK
jgi:hypothetical protein